MTTTNEILSFLRDRDQDLCSIEGNLLVLDDTKLSKTDIANLVIKVTVSLDMSVLCISDNVTQDDENSLISFLKTKKFFSGKQHVNDCLDKLKDNLHILTPTEITESVATMDLVTNVNGKYDILFIDTVDLGYELWFEVVDLYCTKGVKVISTSSQRTDVLHEVVVEDVILNEHTRPSDLIVGLKVPSYVTFLYFLKGLFKVGS